MIKMKNSRLYHGTCKAFVLYALQNKGKFGPDYDSVSFTPDVEHAREFAESWRTPAGLQRLAEYFGKNLKRDMTRPVILQFSKLRLGDLKYRTDGENVDEFYVGRGPVSLEGVKRVV